MDIEKIIKMLSTKKQKFVKDPGAIKINQNKKINSSSLGIKNAFYNGYMNNKPVNLKAGDIYWVLNISTPNYSLLSSNTHPNICLGTKGEYYIGLHCSSNIKAFKNFQEINIYEKPYYICLDRIYIFKKNFIKSNIVNDMSKKSYDYRFLINKIKKNTKKTIIMEDKINDFICIKILNK